ncbi:MAG: 3-hydroxybutyryl-CoA dehydratase [Desulfobacteraceae bacterium]|nr:3-hydroxybutyryl-CoA dehydratase [Desulfobacteraceae bacterium]
MGESLTHYEIKDQVAIVTIDHPPMNALDVPTKEAVGQTFMELDERRKEIRAVILNGAGEKAFAAGADIKAFLEDRSDTARRRMVNSHRVFSIVENCEYPVIAALHGFCLGGGLELSLCCDIRYGDETVKLGFPEVNLSVFPGNGGMWRAMYHLSLGKLKELVYTGDFVGAEEALQLGLLEKVVPKGQVMDAALELAAKIAKKGPLGVIAAKKMVNRARDLQLAQDLSLEAELWGSLADTEDMKEGARAFLEKRKPQWQLR